ISCDLHASSTPSAFDLNQDQILSYYKKKFLTGSTNHLIDPHKFIYFSTTFIADQFLHISLLLLSKQLAYLNSLCCSLLFISKE
ncbi:MAG: hypothetical protein Q8L98_02565, partial [Chlamydiales bacterium]|nr:hypothetical protein [Chlamydiales bacterium]